MKRDRQTVNLRHAEMLAMIAALICFMWWYKDEDQKMRDAVAEDAA